jgi:hypothetical protein
LINSEDEMVSLTTEEMGLTPMAIVVESSNILERGAGGFKDWVDHESEIFIQADLFTIGDVAVQLEGAELWDAKLRQLTTQPKGSQIKTIVGFIQSQPNLRAHVRMLEHVFATYGEIGMPSQGEIGDRYLSAIIEPARMLCQGLRYGDLLKTRDAARGMSGLGEGLTPTGDDFLMGAFLAYHLVNPHGQKTDFLTDVVNALVGRTNILSTSFVECAARGEAALPWHMLVEALEHGSPQVLINACDRIIAIGHSSGADALAGFVASLGYLLTDQIQVS